MRFIRAVLSIGIGVVASASIASAAPSGTATMPAQCDNAHFLSDQNGFADQFARHRTAYGQHSDVPEHVCGTVTRVFRARKSRSGWHGYFLMKVGSGDPIRVVSNLDEMHAPAWPWVKSTDQVEVQGRYYYDGPRRQGLDWTHHGTSRSWPWEGFVTVNGQRYQ